jgi:hypothetical protein
MAWARRVQKSKGFPERAEAIAWYGDHYDDFAEFQLKIRTRDQRLAPFLFNKPQRILDAIVAKQMEETSAGGGKGRVRILVPKARRTGVSTYVQGRFYCKTSLRPLIRAFTIAHKEKSTLEISGIAGRMHSENSLRPPTVANSQLNGIAFAHDSQMAIATAGSPDASRSGDITLLHCSEVAFFEAADDTMTAVMACVPDPPVYSEIFMESTGNGYGNWFQRQVFDSYAEGTYPYYVSPEDGRTYAWKKPGEDWVVVFFPWFSLPENAIPFDNEDMRKEFEREVMVECYRKEVQNLDESKKSEERVLLEKHGLTLEQLNWRRYQLRNKYKSLRDLCQEHPATLHECFQSTGGNVFEASLCDVLDSFTKPPIYRATLLERQQRVVAQSRAEGPLSIWESPVPDTEYLVTVDPAGGDRELQTDKNRPDYTCMDVWKCQGRKLFQVAQWHGRPDYDIIADEAMMLGRLYGKAVIAVLRMNHGLTVLSGLRKDNYPRIAKDDDGKDGLNEDRKRKTTMVDALVQGARDSDIHFVCHETIEEMRSYVERDKKFGAEDGCKDDRVSSAYCAAYAYDMLPKKSLIGKDGAKSRSKAANWDRHPDAILRRKEASRSWVYEIRN